MRTIFPVVLCCFLLWILSSGAARWSNWKDLTTCSAKPCRCDVSKKEKKCSKGEVIQLRVCIQEEGDTVSCKWGKYGPMRRNSCKNKGRNCPGWSEWAQVDKCNCKINRTKQRRKCNNPPPIHPDVLCKSIKKGKVTGVTEEEISVRCNCTEEDRATTTTSTTTTTVATTPLPCCQDMYYDNDYDLNGTSVEINTSFGESSEESTETKEPSPVDLDYYEMYDEMFGEGSERIDCRPCGNSTNIWEDGDTGSEKVSGVLD